MAFTYSTTFLVKDSERWIRVVDVSNILRQEPDLETARKDFENLETIEKKDVKR